MKRQKIASLVGSAVLVASALALSGAGTASAVSVAPPKATGSVALSTPLQYASFSAFPATLTSPVKGSITYTNFGYAVPGTGVWMLPSAVPIAFGLLGGSWPHTMTVTGVTATSPSAFSFTATGVYDPDPSYTWTGTGSVSGTSFALSILYTGTAAGTIYDLVGTISPDGSLSGTVSSPTNGQSGTWASPAGTAFEVFSFTAAVTSATVAGSSATFGFTIPAGTPLAGVPVVVSVTDGGTPGTAGDTWAHNGTTYPITGGNLVVH